MSKAKVVKLCAAREAEIQKQNDVEREQWNQKYDKIEDSWKTTGQKITRSVRNIREELETYKAQLEAVPFDIAEDGIPRCLDNTKRRFTEHLVEELYPRIAGLFDMIDGYARRHGVVMGFGLDFNAKLYELKSESIEMGFKLGVLAGAIFSDASKETVDRFERGLGFGLRVLPWLVKKDA